MSPKKRATKQKNVPRQGFWKRLFKRICLLVLALLLTVGALALYVYREIGDLPDQEQQQRFAKLPNYRNGQFLYPNSPSYYRAPKNYGKPNDHKNLLWRIMTSSEHAPKHPLPMERLDSTSFDHPPSGLGITWLGHSSLVLDMDGVRIMIDPVLGNAAPIPALVRRFQPSPIERGDLPKVDAVLISHNHYDHLERASIVSMIDKTPLFIVPLGVGSTLKGWGCPPEKIVELNWGETFHLPNGLKLYSLPTRHYSARTRLDKSKTLWSCYALTSHKHRVFYSGDGSYDNRFKLFGKQFGPFDLTMIESSAYNIRWADNHLFPDETVQAHIDLKGKYLLPVHWGVFDLAYLPWNEGIKTISKEAKQKKVNLITPIQGQYFIPGKTESTPWWDDMPEE